VEDATPTGTGDRMNMERDSIMYLILVDMPQDIYNKNIFHSVVPKNKSTNYVPKTETGRWYEQHIILPTKTESSATGDNTLPTQTSEETCTTTSEDTEYYWNRDRWTEEEEEEEDMKEDIIDTDKGDLWPLYPEYTQDTSLENNYQTMLQDNNSLQTTGFQFSYPIIPMIPHIPGDPTLLFYELRTNILDPWGYDSVNTTTIRQHHSSDHITQIQVPPVHIYGTTHRLSTSSKYEGFHDNHPLQD
jgi:hypothetical protein